MDTALQTLVIAFGSFLAGSGGFWVYLRRKYEKRDAVDKLIMGLAHDKIVSLGVMYIEKGFVTQDEYDDLFKYFWEPYQDLGGNGSAERIVRLVDLLPLHPDERRLNKETRQAVDSLPRGANNVIEEVKKGDNKFERSPGHKYDR